MKFLFHHGVLKRKLKKSGNNSTSMNNSHQTMRCFLKKKIEEATIISQLFMEILNGRGKRKISKLLVTIAICLWYGCDALKWALEFRKDKDIS
jgi:hypothetical protein